VGGAAHLALEVFQREAGNEFNYVPAAGGAGTLTRSRIPVAPVAEATLQAMAKVYAEKQPVLESHVEPSAVFFGDRGDLAEILDKIGALIRERFKIWGQVQALTGEGRLSGVILLGMPFVLLIAVYQTNPEYVSVLFTDPLGKKMLAVAAFLQVLGAIWIRKVVNIKV